VSRYRGAIGVPAPGVAPTCNACGAMTDRPIADVLDPAAVAAWLDVDVGWVAQAITDGALPVLGHRSDGTPLMATCEIQAWLRRPSVADDET
jgi:hypothetical protein